MLALAVAPSHTARYRALRTNSRSDDLGSLFADLVQDLLGQIEFFGGGLHDVAVDGVLRREDGGYIGWGYASGTLEAASRAMSRLLGTPTASEAPRRASSFMPPAAPLNALLVQNVRPKTEEACRRLASPGRWQVRVEVDQWADPVADC